MAGPKAVLSGLAAKILGERPHVAIALDNGTGLPGLLNAFGQLLAAGIALDPRRLFAGRDCRIGDPSNLASLKPLLDRLPLRERRILALRFFDGRTQSEIATELGISQMHVSRLLARTLEQLREGMLTSN